MAGQSNAHKWFVIARKILFNGMLPCLVFIFILFVWLCLDIRSNVKDISAKATQEYSGERVEALIAYIQSEKHSLRDRNRAVWALGRIGDKRALPVLEQFCTGKPCDHDKYLCQREINKAIDLCKTNFKVSSWISRY